MTETDPSTENPDKPGRDETGKEQEIKDVPKDDRVELKPLSMSSLHEAVQDDFNLVKDICTEVGVDMPSAVAS